VENNSQDALLSAVSSNIITSMNSVVDKMKHNEKQQPKENDFKDKQTGNNNNDPKIKNRTLGKDKNLSQLPSKKKTENSNNNIHNTNIGVKQQLNISSKTLKKPSIHYSGKKN